MVKIGLDAGHGLYTVGKQTPNGIKEWSLNDKVRDKVVAILADYDCEIINVDNNEGNTDETLANRLNRYLNAGASAFVSIHHNAYTGKWNNATGVEVYTDKKPTAADKKLADLIYGKMVKYTLLRGRGIKKASFAVINQNKIPAVLVEGGFMDSNIDYKVITSDAGQNAYARAVAEGLIEYLGLVKKSVSKPQSYEAKTDVTYQVWDNVKKLWLPNVKNDSDYAGILGHDVCCVYANLSKGNIFYRVHTKGGIWLPEVKNRTDYAGLYSKKIDAVMFKTDVVTPLKYRVHLKKKNIWLPWVSGYSTIDGNNGFAGIIGQEIDAIQIKI